MSTEIVTTGKAAPALDGIVQRLQALAEQTDPAATKITDLDKIAHRAGDSFKDLAQAYAGNATGLDQLIAREGEHRDSLQREAEAQSNDRAGQDRVQSIFAQQEAIVSYIGYLTKSRNTVREAAKAEQEYAAAGGPELAAKAASTQSYADSVQASLSDAGGAWKDYQHGQKVNLDKYNDHIEAAIKAQEHYAANVRTATQTLSQDALNYIETLGADAAPLLQQYIDAPNGMKARTASNWDKLGRAASSSYSSALKDGIPDAIPGPQIQIPQVSSNSLDDALRGAQRQLNNNPLSVQVIGRTRYGKPLF